MLDDQANYAGELRAVLRARVGRARRDARRPAPSRARSTPGSRSRSFPELLKELGISPECQFILFGLGALTYAKHPEGILEAQKRQRIDGDPAAASTGASAAATQPMPAGRRRPGAVPTPARATDGSAVGRDAARRPRHHEAVRRHHRARRRVARRRAAARRSGSSARTAREDHLLQLPARHAAPDGGSGRVRRRGTSPVLPVYRRARLGIGRTFQRIELFGGMTVRDHLLVAERARLGTGRLWKDCLNLSQADRRTRSSAPTGRCALLGLDDVADRPVEALSLGRGRLVELGRALMTEPKLLLLDEPSSGLDQHETRGRWCARCDDVQRERGTAILLVEHDVEMVQAFATPPLRARLRHADRRGPDRRGARRRRGPQGVPREIATSTTSPRRGAPSGRATRPRRRTCRRRRPPVAPLLELRDVDAGYGPFRALFGVSFAVAEGKVVALLGANGAGKTTVARVVSGSSRHRRARCSSTAVDITGSSRGDIAPLGIVHAPEGRSVFARSPSRRTSRSTSAAASAAGASRRARAGVRAVPAARRAPQADRRHALGRRAAHALARPGARASRRACSSPTSCRSASRRSSSTRCTRRSSRSASRDDAAHRRAVRRPRAADRRRRRAAPARRSRVRRVGRRSRRRRRATPLRRPPLTSGRPPAQASANRADRHVGVAGDVRHLHPAQPGFVDLEPPPARRRAPRSRSGSPCGRARRRGSCARRGRTRW